jgi:NADH dehydrogenase FAD-containing subunit
MKNLVLIGGGHCNCQVLKMLKKDFVAMNLTKAAKMKLVTETPRSYYSGMLPGAVSSKLDDPFIHII